MNQKSLRSNLLLLLAAAIWGFSFVAQRVGSEYMGPFSFNGIRFGLGSISLLPLVLFYRKKPAMEEEPRKAMGNPLKAGLVAGIILFMGASLQQIGVEETTAGKAAFITGLYIVLVPIFGIILKHRVRANVWLGVMFALVGLYLLCVTKDFTIARGDLLVFVGAFFWTAHILIIDRYSKTVDILMLSIFQFMTCSLLSLIVAIFNESITLNAILHAGIPLMYGGIFTVGIAYTLQAVGQKNAPPAHAAIILSMETVFATLGGFLMLNETLATRGYVGCLLMLTGMLLSQLTFAKKPHHSMGLNS